MKHKLLSTAAVLLLVLLTWSCTTDNDPVPAPVTSAPRELSISIGPRPAYTAGATLPATRAVQTPDAAQWETGDVIWLHVGFDWTPAGGTQANKTYISALRYNGAGWSPLSVQDSIDLNTSGIKPAIGGPINFSGFKRHPRWPAEALADGTTDAKVRFEAYYLGTSIPVDGILSLGYTTDVMTGSDSFSPGVPAVISLEHRYARMHVANEVDGTELMLSNAKYYYELNLSNMNAKERENGYFLSVPAKSGYHFAAIDNNSKVYLNRRLYNLLPGRIDESGNEVYNGFTYTLIPLKNGTVTPGDW